MAVDYDLVIIGGSPAGVWAAIAAAHLRARVALVVDRWQVGDRGYLQALNQVGRTTHQLSRVAQYGFSAPSPAFPQWGEALRWATTTSAALEDLASPLVLAARGVDVIEGRGEFHRRPRLGFQVENRILRSRSFLLTPPRRAIVPDIPGIQTIEYLTPLSLPTATLEIRPDTLLVLGGDPAGIELAQVFNRLGTQVTIVLTGPHLLPREDPDGAFLLQAHLEAEGIQVLTETPVVQVQAIDGKKWVQVGNRAIAVDEILLAAGQQPDLASLNLNGVGVRDSPFVNRKLQTTHPRIYACLGMVAGFPFDHAAIHEARTALKNALFFPLFQVDDRLQLRFLFTEPEWVSIGLSEPDARQRYGKSVMVIHQSFKSLERAQINGAIEGFCKLIVGRNGEILGAHLIGNGVSEAIAPLSLVMQQKRSIDALTRLVIPNPTITEVIQRTAAEWQRQRRAQNPFTQDLLEDFFSLGRSWSG